MSNRRRPYPAFRTNHRNLLANERPVRIDEEIGYRTDDLDRVKRRHEVFADAARNQLAIEFDVIDGTDNHDLHVFVAMFGQRIDLGQHLLGCCRRLDHQKVGSRVLLHIGRCSGNTAGD